ncbi:MAG: hypothetical protein QJR13_06230 [Bacillota bacterium]|nr:hypothetical protein [Bacillota bacterium]
MAWSAHLKSAEEALLDHPAVAEAGVVRRPDPEKGETCTAFVVLRPGCEPSEAIREELAHYLEARLGAEDCPQEVRFCRALPKTRSGKILWASFLAVEVEN